MQLFFGYTGILHRSWHQILFGNLKLLKRRVARKLNHLHTIQQRSGNGVIAVRRADKEHVGQII